MEAEISTRKKKEIICKLSMAFRMSTRYIGTCVRGERRGQIAEVIKKAYQKELNNL